MSICFDFDEFLLFLEYNSADLLSQLIFNSLSMPSTIRNPTIKFHGYIPWFNASKEAINSASMVEEATSDSTYESGKVKIAPKFYYEKCFYFIYC